MATLGQLGEAVTEQLRERTDRLVAAIENDESDFTEIAGVADALAEFADTIGDIYTDLEHRLLRGPESGAGDVRAAQQQPRGGDRPSSAQVDSASEEVTKEQLIEQARELHVEGRSSMTKEELAQAVQAEESVTKDELLERAREAHIEGRSSMTKDELRDALHHAGT